VEFDDHEQRERRQREVHGESSDRAPDEAADEDRQEGHREQLPGQHHSPVAVRGRREQDDRADKPDEDGPAEVADDDALQEDRAGDRDERPREECVEPAVPEQPLQWIRIESVPIGEATREPLTKAATAL
jgi:hypothetical protein